MGYQEDDTPGDDSGGEEAIEDSGTGDADSEGVKRGVGDTENEDEVSDHLFFEEYVVDYRLDGG